jgi:hypothetical protein
MQNQLHVLQPQLIDTSEKTEKLMIKIEQDTVVVEAKKEVFLFFFFSEVLLIVCNLSVVCVLENEYWMPSFIILYPSKILLITTGISHFPYYTLD